MKLSASFSVVCIGSKVRILAVAKVARATVYDFPGFTFFGYSIRYSLEVYINYLSYSIIEQFLYQFLLKEGKNSGLYSLLNSMIVQLTLSYKNRRKHAELCRICPENTRKFEAAITKLTRSTCRILRNCY